MPFDKLLNLMASYDAAEVGTPERVNLGMELDKESAKKIRSEKDYWKVVYEYKKRTEAANKLL